MSTLVIVGGGFAVLFLTCGNYDSWGLSIAMIWYIFLAHTLTTLSRTATKGLVSLLVLLTSGLLFLAFHALLALSNQ